MSIGPLGGIQGSAAGAPLSQTKGSETEKSQQQAAATQRQADGAEKSERTSGIGTTEEDQETSDRDADGRRMYEDTDDARTAPDSRPAASDNPQAKDATKQSGNQLDLLG